MHVSELLPFVQATVEAGYLVAQAVLYVCVLYFMAGFDRTAGELLHLPHIASLMACITHPVTACTVHALVLTTHILPPLQVYTTTAGSNVHALP